MAPPLHQHSRSLVRFVQQPSSHPHAGLRVQSLSVTSQSFAELEMLGQLPLVIEELEVLEPQDDNATVESLNIPGILLASELCCLCSFLELR